MSNSVQPIRSRPAPLPPAAGQFGLLLPTDGIDQHGYRPSGCPSVEQFEARLISSSDPKPLTPA